MLSVPRLRKAVRQASFALVPTHSWQPPELLKTLLWTIHSKESGMPQTKRGKHIVALSWWEVGPGAAILFHSKGTRPMSSQTAGPLESSLRMLAFDSSWGFSLILWHTYVLLRQLGHFLPTMQWCSGGYQAEQAPADKTSVENRRVSIGLRSGQWGCFVILLVESKPHLVIFPNLVFRKKKKKHLPGQELCKVPGALLCYPQNRFHLAHYLDNLTRIHGHPPITVFLPHMPSRWVQCRHGRRTPEFLQSWMEIRNSATPPGVWYQFQLTLM